MCNKCSLKVIEKFWDFKETMYNEIDFTIG